MASVSLVSSPPAPVLDKNMTDSELAGDERSSNILMQFLIYAHLCVSVLWVYMLVLLVFSFNHELQGVETFPRVFSPPYFLYLHASLVQLNSAVQTA